MRFVSCNRVSWLRASLGSLYGVLRLCEGAGGCGRARGAKARERRVWTPYRGRFGLSGARGRGCVAGVRRAVDGCVTLLLSAAGVTHVLWNKRAATGVTRVGRVVFTREGLTCCSRARMLGVKCR